MKNILIVILVILLSSCTNSSPATPQPTKERYIREVEWAMDAYDRALTSSIQAAENGNWDAFDNYQDYQQEILDKATLLPYPNNCTECAKIDSLLVNAAMMNRMLDEAIENKDSNYHESHFDEYLKALSDIRNTLEKPDTLKESISEEGCPNGCTTHKSGCDIKGNISYNTKEKIYHVPGQNFYNDTKISPEYGERWFCTEAEAKANGWRKAKN